MHHVEAGIDIGRHPAGGGIADHLAGRRRLDVARPDRRGRIDHHRRQPLLAHQVHHRPLGQELRALVGADEIRLVGRRGLVGRRAIGRHPQRRDRTAVHDALHPRRLGRTHHRQRALDIGAQHRLGIGHPEPVVRRDVEHIAAAGGGARQRRGIGEVAQRQFRIDAGQVAPVAGRPDQQAQPMPARRQHPRDRGTDEAGRTGQQCRAIRCHAAILPSKPPAYSPVRRNRCRAARPPPPPGRKVRPREEAFDRACPGWPAARHRADRLVRVRPRDRRPAPRRLGGFRADRGMAACAVRRAGPRLGCDHAAARGTPPLGVRLGPHGARRLGQLPAVLPGGRLRVRRPGSHPARRVVVAGDRLHGGRRHRRVPRPGRVHRHRSRHPAGARAEFGAGGAAGDRARAGGDGRRGADLAAAGRRAAVRPARPAHRRTLVRGRPGSRRGAAGRAVADLRPRGAAGDRLLHASAGLDRHRCRGLDHLPRARACRSTSTTLWRSRRC